MHDRQQPQMPQVGGENRDIAKGSRALPDMR